MLFLIGRRFFHKNGQWRNFILDIDEKNDNIFLMVDNGPAPRYCETNRLNLSTWMKQFKLEEWVEVE